jgi:DNA-binding SARP family transcriptional activator
MLKVWLLGVLRLEADGGHVAPPSSKRARLLLAMLALDRRPHSREMLASWLWPEVRDDSARASLRTALAQLRSALGPDAGRYLQSTREHVTLAGPEEVWIDVGELERRLHEGRVQAALELSGKELLTGLESEWVYARRDALRQLLVESLGFAAGEAEAAGDLEAALLLTRRLVALDPLDEEPQRELIRRLARADESAAALAAYDKLAQRLRERYGTIPSAATRELAAAVRDGAAADELAGDKRAPFNGGAASPPAASSGEGARAWQTLPRPLQAVTASPSPFVGREVELEYLAERWRQVCDGARRAVVVAGEPGIGKTRLAAELARTVQDEGALVLYGRCDEGLVVPYQPFVQALRPYAHAVGPERLRTQLGGLAPELGRLLPELAGLGEPIRSDPESERFALFEAVAALIEAMTTDQHALLVLDDVHWAATPTLLLLRHLIRCDRSLGVLLLCTYRETELGRGQPLAQLLADLQRDPGTERLSIGGLGDRAIAVLLEAAVGHVLDEPASELVAMLGSQTAGNPFFIHELLANLLAESDAIAAVTAAQLEAPEGLKHVIGQRVARLSAAAGRALSAAAVAGPTFSFVLLERVLGERAGALDALEEAVAAGLLSDTGHGQYIFAHALVRQTIYEQLGSARRMHLHRQLGEALEALGNTQANVEALAQHFAQAAADGQGVKAAAYALAAGRSAAGRLAYEQAAAHFERGLQSLELSTEPQEQLRYELLLALGDARWGAGELDRARYACGQAAEVAEQLGDATALADAALGFCGPHRFEQDAALTEPVAGLLERALAALPSDDSTLRAQLMGRLAGYTAVAQRRPVLARQALRMARRLDDKATIADVLASTHWVTHGPDALHESLTLAAELGRVADECGNRLLRALAHRRLLDHHLELGDIEAVERELDALQRLAETRTERYVVWVLKVLRASYAHLGGRLAECEALAHDALAHRFEGNDESAAQKFAIQMVSVRREQGRLDKLVDTVEDLATHFPQVDSWRCALAYIYAQLECMTQARRELDRLAHGGFSAMPRDASWLPNLSTLSEVVVFLGDAPRAQLLYELLLPYADRCVITSNLLCQGSASRPLGLLATTLARYEAAERHFEQALKTNAQIRSPLWIAHTQHDYARMLLLRNRREDRAKTLALLDDAIAVAEELGLEALAGKARPLKLTAEAAGSPPDSPAPE